MKVSMDYSSGEDCTAVTWYSWENGCLVVHETELIEPKQEAGE